MSNLQTKYRGSRTNTPSEATYVESPFSSYSVLNGRTVIDADLVYIKKDNDKEISLSNLPPNTAKTTTIPAPSLTAGHYVLEWSVFTPESTVLRGKIRFIVSAEGVAALASPALNGRG